MSNVRDRLLQVEASLPLRLRGGEDTRETPEGYGGGLEAISGTFGDAEGIDDGLRVSTQRNR